MPTCSFDFKSIEYEFVKLQPTHGNPAGDELFNLQCRAMYNLWIHGDGSLLI